ncbi:MAG: hypothetical protein L0346_22400, partial [Chloroflexi bacterium]|nr:hypothetical protein [Chloroflexota bacterium]
RPPAHLVATRLDPGRWLLGRSGAGTPLHVAGPINLYGRQEAVAEWLVHQVIHTVAGDPAGLVVIDGAGDLVPRLKRKAAVTRLLSRSLVYVEIDGTAVAIGFNPLAAAPGEAAEATLRRWQRWFAGLNVPAPGLELLAAAWRDGVGDIPALRKWLRKPERYSQQAAVASLEGALNRLAAEPRLREWLEWPANRFAGLPGGALFFACQGRDWARRQLLRAALLGALAVEGTRLIVHGFPWQEVEIGEFENHGQIVAANGPRLPGSAVVLVENHPQGVTALAQRYLPVDARLRENLELLCPGEAIMISGDDVFYASWQ